MKMLFRRMAGQSSVSRKGHGNRPNHRQSGYSAGVTLILLFFTLMAPGGIESISAGPRTDFLLELGPNDKVDAPWEKDINRSPAITGPATDKPVTPGENGDYYEYHELAEAPKSPAIRRVYSFRRKTSEEAELSSGLSD